MHLVDKSDKKRGGTSSPLILAHGDTEEPHAPAKAKDSPGLPPPPPPYRGTLPPVRSAMKKITQSWEMKKNKRQENF